MLSERSGRGELWPGSPGRDVMCCRVGTWRLVAPGTPGSSRPRGRPVRRQPRAILRARPPVPRPYSVSGSARCRASRARPRGSVAVWRNAREAVACVAIPCALLSFRLQGVLHVSLACSPRLGVEKFHSRLVHQHLDQTFGPLLVGVDNTTRPSSRRIVAVQSVSAVDRTSFQHRNSARVGVGLLQQQHQQ